MNTRRYQLRLSGLRENKGRIRAFIISGWLEEIQQDSGRFFLGLGDGRKIFGRLQSDQLDIEVLRSLWGKRVTVQGMVHFKANGQPRLIEAHRLRPYQDRDAVFEELPSTEMPKSRGLTRIQEKQARSFNVLSLCGAWPGNEPVEELLARLARLKFAPKEEARISFERSIE